MYVTKINYKNCPICEYKDKKEVNLIKHLKLTHKDLLKTKDMTARQFLYHQNKDDDNINKCKVCGEDVEWEEERSSYPTICGSSSCRREMHEKMKRDVNKGKGVRYKITDPDLQKNKLFKRRKQARKYKWSNSNKKFLVLNTVAYEALRVLDEDTRLDPDVVEAPAPFFIKFTSEVTDRKYMYFPDIYLKDINLIISCKEVNTDEVTSKIKEDRFKMIDEYRTILNDFDYNYIQIESQKEAKQLPHIIKRVRRIYNKGGRYVVPPKINTTLYGESPRSHVPINYLLIGLNQDGNPVSLFLSKDVLGDNMVIHCDGKGIVLADGKEMLDKYTFLVGELNEPNTKIDLVQLQQYLNFRGMEGSTMIDLIAYHWGIPVEYDMEEKLKAILMELGGRSSLKTYEEYTKEFDKAMEDVNILDDNLEIEELDGGRKEVVLGGEPMWEID